LKTHQQLVNKAKALSESERVTLKPAISSIERQIIEEAGKRYPAYNRLVDELGVRGNIKAKRGNFLIELVSKLFKLLLSMVYYGVS